MFRRISVTVLCMLVLCLSGCNRFKQIKVNSVALESVSPNGLRGFDLGVAVGIDNPATDIGLSDIEGALKYSGKVLGRVSLDPFTLHRRSAEIYHLKAKVGLESGVRLQELLPLLKVEMLNQCTLDVSVRVTLKKNVSKVLDFKDIPVKKLLEQNVYEKE